MPAREPAPASGLSWVVSSFPGLAIGRRRRPHPFRLKRSTSSAPAEGSRGPPPASPPCPTSLATGRLSGPKTSRICSKCWVRRFLSAEEQRGDVGGLGGGREEEGALEAGRGGLGARIPKERGRAPWLRGAGSGHRSPVSPAGLPPTPARAASTPEARGPGAQGGAGAPPPSRSCKPCVRAASPSPCPIAFLGDIPASFPGPRR